MFGIKTLEKKIEDIESTIKSLKYIIKPVIGIYYSPKRRCWLGLRIDDIKSYHADNKFIEVNQYLRFGTSFLDTSNIIFLGEYSPDILRKKLEIEKKYVKNEKNNKRNRN